MPDIAVFHLIHADNDRSSLERFVDSYKRNAAGVDHHLIFILKAFGPVRSFEDYDLVNQVDHRIFEVDNEGFDITAYVAAARKFADEYEYFCFLNSHSEILANDWLKKLFRQFGSDQVGLVGATGSWQSHRSGVVSHVGDRSRVIWSKKGKDFWVHVLKIVRNLLGSQKTWKGLADFYFRFKRFDQFPNVHLRTNCFMIRAGLMNQVVHGKVATKLDAYEFESGKGSLTRRVLDQGLSVLVVGRDGRAFDWQDWDKSGTFWQGQQENLLVADNRTRDYTYADPERKRELAGMAWGS